MEKLKRNSKKFKISKGKGKGERKRVIDVEEEARSDEKMEKST